MVNQINTKPIRCKACGKPVEEDADGIMCLTQGGFNNRRRYVENKPWGYLHEACFMRAVDMPSLALEQIRKVGRSATRSAAKASRS